MPANRHSAARDVVVMDSSYEYLLQKVLGKNFSKVDSTVKVKDIQDVVPKGENYLSSLHRVFLETSVDGLPVEEKIVIVKVLPKGEFLQKFIRNCDVFRTEILMYNKVLPEMNRIATEVLGLPTFSAKSFATGDDDFIVLEDLKLGGYKMADRFTGLDLDHCTLAIKSLARFHGISVAMATADRSIFDTLPGNLFRQDIMEAMDPNMRAKYKHLAEMVETWPGFERFGDRLRAASTTMTKKLLQLNDVSKLKMAVLNHGDSRLNNMLFKYSDSGEVVDVKFVDFQIVKYSSPAVDLHYFLIGNPNDEVRETATQTLLKVYHSELCRVMEALGCDSEGLTLDWLRQEMKDKMFYALHVACSVLNIFVVDPDDSPDLSKFTEEGSSNEMNSMFLKSYTSARFRQILEKLLLKFEKEGIL